MTVTDSPVLFRSSKVSAAFINEQIVLVAGKAGKAMLSSVVNAQKIENAVKVIK